MTTTSPPGSHAWCSDCPWTAHRLEGLAARAKAHSDEKQHIVHLFESDPAIVAMTAADSEQEARDHAFDTED